MNRELAKLAVLNLIAYTFLVYNNSTLTFFNSPYLSAVFFGSSSYLSLAATIGSAALGLAMRPIGGWTLGPLGDRLGRRALTRIGSVGSVVPLLVVAMLPGYRTLGLTASVTFLSLLGVQGFFTGGLTGGINVIGLESLEERDRGWFSGSGMAVSGTSFLVATAVYSVLVVALGQNQYALWGWRIMFLTSSLMLLFGFVLPESKKFGGSKARRTVSYVVRTYRRRFVLAASLTALWGSLAFTAEGLLPTFLLKVDHLSSIQVSEALLVYSIFTAASGFLGGALSEVKGRKFVSGVGALLALAGVPLYLALAGARSPDEVVAIVAPLSFVLVFGGGAVMVLVNESFPTEVRSTGVSISWNLGFMTAGITSLLLSYIASIVGNLALVEAVGTGGLALTTMLVTSYYEETRGAMDRT